MVERTEGLIEFEAVVTDIEFEPATSKEFNSQYKITMQTPASKKSGFMYEWIGLPDTATEGVIPSGSNVDKYLQELEVALPETKKAKTIGEALNMMKGRKFKFVRKKLGKAYKGHDAKEFWCPHQLL